MKKFLIAAAVAASALSATAPAAAQWYPQPQQPGYGYNNYGYGNGRGLMQRVERIRWQIRMLDQRDRLSNREAAYLDNEARDLLQRIRYSAGDGVNPRERQALEWRVQRLEQRVRAEANDGNWRAGGFRDRDRDGRPDRYEDDRGYDHDGRWDR
ncbi:hypothetical protein HMF7854_06235 [Sphingomonas ginkgonis]|uniref:Uncharacterized protein n=1 Tax=Sphingomonas ginkgonis TaxID=2315330 RepID=A0A429V915_9SPHN|nr:hypothetical protein [Sphingomonas ginkgonis]RST30473.1 hypothetical protein HMF7854_06235 [Sphingomonas ginkgonis]